jgi:hypothetical protein
MSKTVAGTMQVKEVAQVLNNVGAGLGTQTFINANAATLALKAEDSGKTILLNRAAGCDVTLPAAAEGLKYKFLIIASVTSNDYSVTAAAATDLFYGLITNIDTDNTNALAFYAPDGSDDDAFSLDGSTQGGLIGDEFEVTCIGPAKWWFHGTLRGTGTVATPFA